MLGDAARGLGAGNARCLRVADGVRVRRMKAVNSLSAPAAIGPYSQGVDAGDFVFLSGQIPIDPKTARMTMVLAPAWAASPSSVTRTGR